MFEYACNRSIFGVDHKDFRLLLHNSIPAHITCTIFSPLPSAANACQNNRAHWVHWLMFATMHSQLKLHQLIGTGYWQTEKPVDHEPSVIASTVNFDLPFSTETIFTREDIIHIPIDWNIQTLGKFRNSLVSETLVKANSYILPFNLIECWSMYKCVAHKLTIIRRLKWKSSCRSFISLMFLSNLRDLKFTHAIPFH